MTSLGSTTWKLYSKFARLPASVLREGYLVSRRLLVFQPRCSRPGAAAARLSDRACVPGVPGPACKAPVVPAACRRPMRPLRLPASEINLYVAAVHCRSPSWSCHRT